MSARAAVLLLVLTALAPSLPMAASADLKCQARTTHMQPSFDATFEALTGDGQPPFAFDMLCLVPGPKQFSRARVTGIELVPGSFVKDAVHNHRPRPLEAPGAAD